MTFLFLAGVQMFVYIYTCAASWRGTKLVVEKVESMVHEPLLRMQVGG